MSHQSQWDTALAKMAKLLLLRYSNLFHIPAAHGCIGGTDVAT
jgi:hypothetical protein